MSETPLISVGIPVYNGGRWITATVESLLCQTQGDFEIVICDNASSDDTEQLCRELAANDARVHYHRNPKNLGAPENYNLTFRRSRGTYFKWNSASDLCRDTFLERCIEVLEQRPDVVLAYPHTELLFEDGRLEKEQHDLALLSDRPSERFCEYIQRVGLNHAMNGVMRREQLARTALHLPFYSSDICLMAELSLAGKFVQVPDYLFIRRNTAETASSLHSGLELQRYFDPDLEKRMLFQRYKLYLAYYRAVKRAPIETAEKRIINRFLLKQMRWSRYQFLQDAVLDVKKLLRRRS